jgi:hypothetical protein
MADQQVLLKNLPGAGLAAGASPPVELRTMLGQWKNSSSRYGFTFDSDGRTVEMGAEMKNGRLAVTIQGVELAFLRDD